MVAHCGRSGPAWRGWLRAWSLAERIVAGEFKPGERLVKATIAKPLKLSQGPIREALRLLQSVR